MSESGRAGDIRGDDVKKNRGGEKKEKENFNLTVIRACPRPKVSILWTLLGSRLCSVYNTKEGFVVIPRLVNK